MDSFDSVFTGRSGEVTVGASHRYVSLAFKIHGPLHSQSIRLIISRGLMSPEMSSRMLTLSKKIGLPRSQYYAFFGRVTGLVDDTEYVEPVCSLVKPKGRPLSETILDAFRRTGCTMELVVLPSTSRK